MAGLGLTTGAYGYLSDYLLCWLLYLSLLLHTWCFFRFLNRAAHSRLRLILGNGLIFACLLGLVALFAESYLRFVSVSTDAFGVSLPARRWFALNTTLNSLGCRDADWSGEKPRGVRRIAFVGDSYTYGWGVARVEDRFTDLIQAAFDRRAPGSVEVMNVAKPGWNTSDELQPVKDLIAFYGVDEILLCYVPNDIENVIPKRGEFDPTRPPEWHLFNLDSSCLLDYLYRRLYLPHAPTVRGYHDWLAGGFSEPNLWRLHVTQIIAIVRYCEERNVRLRAVLLPFLRTSGEAFDSDRIHERLRSLFAGDGVPVVDLLPLVTGRDPTDLVVNACDPHPNEAAHALFANAIWRTFYAGVGSAAGSPTTP